MTISVGTRSSGDGFGKGLAVRVGWWFNVPDPEALRGEGVLVS